MSVTERPSGSEVQAPGGFLIPFGIEIEPGLLKLALTHRSWAYEHDEAPHNERLEFLGDSILGQSVTWRLFREYPDAPEGELSRRRAALVSTESLATLARGIGLGEHIKLGRGEKRSGGQDKDSILADTLEAVIGAVFASCGPAAADEFVHALVDPLFADLEELIVFFDPKTTLQEEAVARGEEPPQYQLQAEGPDHDRKYIASIIFGGVTGVGRASNKKAAELLAAKHVVKELMLAGKLVTQKEHNA